MTPEQITLVTESWKKVSPIADTAATLFYDRLFELDPALRPLFKGDMADQKVKLMQTLGFAVASLKNLDALIPIVQDLGRRHAGYGVTDAMYGTVADALLWTLEKGLGAGFTPEVKAAWVETYTTLAGVMKAAAQTR
jgi:hemoglobin-like flavoprotein